MRKNRMLAVIVIFILIFPSFSFTALADEQQQEINDRSLIDFFRYLKIEFEPPQTIQDCGSSFLLDVTITSKPRLINSARRFSVSVFLQIEDNSGNKKIIRIGSKPFIYILPSEEKTIRIPCLTTYNLSSTLYCFRSKEKSEFDIKKGSIGVKINRIRRLRLPSYIIDRLKYKWLFTERFFNSILLNKNFPIKRIPKGDRRIFSFFQNCHSFLVNNNPFIVWKEVNLTSPFMCSKGIDFEYVKVQNKTDINGNFYVNINISNNLEEDVYVNVLVDLSTQSIFNDLLPLLPEGTIYNVGWFEDMIHSGSFTNKSLKCSFPDDNFFNKNYEVTIECAPYIMVGNTNQFGKYFYDTRFMNYIKPIYILNATVLNSIKKVWYNTPIFYGDPDLATIFLVSHNSTYYNGNTLVDEILKEGKKIIFGFIPILLLLVFLILILFGLYMGLIYWIVRKKSK